MNFKDCVAADIHKVFLNTGEFAQRRTVRYDGMEYPDVPLVLEELVQEQRDRLTDDHVGGLHRITAVLYCARADLGGKTPKQGAGLEIAAREGGRFFQKYYIVSSACGMGMLEVRLEAVAQ